LAQRRPALVSTRLRHYKCAPCQAPGMGSDKSNRGKGRRRSSRINRRPSPCALRGRFGRPSPCALCGRFGLTVTWCVRPLVFIRFWHGEDSGTGQVRAIRFTIYDLRLVRGHPQGPESIHTGNKREASTHRPKTTTRRPFVYNHRHQRTMVS